MTDQVPPPDAFARLAELSTWLEEGDGLVLGVDFDGTLAPITGDHTEPTVTPAARAALMDLSALPSVALAVISGRSREDLRDRVGVDGIVYGGNHGLELAFEGYKAVHPDAEDLRPTIRRLCEDLRTQFEDVPGCTVENKGVTATVHFRRTPADEVSEVVSKVEEVVDKSEPVTIESGKAVREIRPEVDWNKGRMMGLLTESAPDGWRSMYIGDDVTDEDAFRAIQPEGIGIRVDDGTTEAIVTEARFRLRGREAVPRFLSWIATELDSTSTDAAEPDPWKTFLDPAEDWSDGDPLVHSFGATER